MHQVGKMTSKNHLLSDEDIRHFITRGYVQVQTDFEDNLHQQIYDQIERVFGMEGNPGNNVLPRIPNIQEVFAHPKVVGALTSLLGENYIIHPHRYCHLRDPGSGDQSWHKDDYIFDQNVRHHRFRWVMAFYYPQDVTVDMGATATLPSRQYYNTISSTNPDETTENEVKLCGKAGTVSIVNFDVWHRGSANSADKKRYMLKFQFTRMKEPTRPTWNIGNLEWEPVEGDKHNELSRNVWNWLCGKRTPVCNQTSVSHKEVSKLVQDLSDPNETVRINSAYAFSNMGKSVVETLIESLKSESFLSYQKAIKPNGTNPQGGNPSDLYSGHALAGLGEVAVPKLIQILNDPNWWVRAAAADIIGNIVPVVHQKEAVSELTNRLQDSEWWVRRNATEALGYIGVTTQHVLDQLKFLLDDGNELVRRNALITLSKLVHTKDEMIPMLVEKITNDNGRYVRFYAMVALRQIKSKKAEEALFHVLLSSRWCALTTAETPF